MIGVVAGGRVLLGLGVRRERLLAPLTVLLFALVDISTAVSIGAMYGQPQQLAALRAGVGSSAAFVFLLGPFPSDDTTAALTAWRAGLFLITALAVCAVLAVTRQTRREEEAGRAELVLSGAVGRWAPLVAATTVTAVLVTGVSIVMAVIIAAVGGSAYPAFVVFLQYWATGLAATGTALFAAEVAASRRSANLVASGVVAGGYLLRGVADTVPAAGWLRWCSPVGWAQEMDPFGTPNLWPAAAALAVFVAGGVGAGFVRDRRDLGAGLFSRRPGPARGPRRWPLPAIVWTLVRSQALAWAAAVGVYAFVVGALSGQVESLAAENRLVTDFLSARGDGVLTDLFVSTMMGVLAVAAAGAGVAVLATLRTQEKSGRAELMLSTAVSRRRYLVAHAAVAGWSALVVLIAAAGGLALGAGSVGNAPAHVLELSVIGAACSMPAVALLLAVTLAAYGWGSAGALAGPPVVLVALVSGPLAELFGVPTWLAQISPFTHTPVPPIGAEAWLPLTVISVLAVAVSLVGLRAWTSRDVG